MSNIIQTSYGALKISVSFDGDTIQLNSTNFKYLIMESRYGVIGQPNIGINIPICELQFTVADYNQSIKIMKSVKTEVSIQIASSPQMFGSFIYKYNIVNIDIDIGEFPIVTIYCIYDLGEFTSKIEQKSYKDLTFMELFTESNITTIPLYVKSDGLKTEDKMTWIRPNTSEYQFLSDSCKFINSPENLILLAPVVHESKMKLKLISYDKEIIKPSENGLILGQKPSRGSYKNIIEANTFKIETSRGSYTQNIGSENYVPVLKLPSQKQEEESSILSFFIKKVKDTTERKITKPMPSKMDMGNTHDKWWESRTLNEKRILSLYNSIVIVESETSFIENEIQLLDTIYLENNLPGNNGTLLEGNFIIMGISKYITNTSFNMQLILGRDFYK